MTDETRIAETRVAAAVADAVAVKMADALAPIANTMDRVTARLETLEGRVIRLETAAEMPSPLVRIEENQGKIQARVEELATWRSEIREPFAAMREDQGALKAQVAELKEWKTATAEPFTLMQTSVADLKDWRTETRGAFALYNFFRTSLPVLIVAGGLLIYWLTEGEFPRR